MLTPEESTKVFNEVFTIDGDRVIFNGTLGRVYLREKYFKRGSAEIIDKDVQTIGIFKLYVHNDVTKNPADFAPGDHEIVFKIPTSIVLCPTNMYETIVSEYNELETEAGMNTEMERVKYYVLEFPKGSVFIKSLMSIKSVNNLKAVTSMVTGAQLPDEIGYTDTAKLWVECSEINGYGSMKSNTSLLELIVSQIFRNPYNLSEPFRYYLARHPDADLSIAKPIRMVDIAKQVSAFGSLTSGDPVRGITSSIIRQRKGYRDTQTPIEEQIK